MTDKHQQLIQAITKNDAHRVKLLLHEDPNLVRARDTEGRTPILLSLYFGFEALAEVIREKTPTPDLFEAAALGETDLLKQHLARDPDLANAVAQDGFAVLGLASFFGRNEAAGFLLESGADPNTPSANDFKVRPIHSAAANRSVETSLPLCKTLLEGGADPNVAQAGGWTPLHQAATHGRMPVVQLLLAHGAKVDAKSDDDRTAAEMAKVKGHSEIQTLLEEAGA